MDWTVRRPKGDHKFIQSKDDIILMEGAKERVFQYRDLGFLVYGISNQGGVAAGYKTSIDVVIEFRATIDLFGINNPFNKILYCPDAEGTRRKPNTGMVEEVVKGLRDVGIGVNWESSLFVGDMESDKQCAENARINFMWAKDWLEPHEIRMYFN